MYTHGCVRQCRVLCFLVKYDVLLKYAIYSVCCDKKTKDSSRFSYYRHRDNGERQKGKKGFRSISETPVLLYNFYIFIFCTTKFFFKLGKGNKTFFRAFP